MFWTFCDFHLVTVLPSAVCNCNDWSISFTHNIVKYLWFQRIRDKQFLVYFLLHDSELNIFWLWTIQDISGRHLGLWSTFFLTFIRPNNWENDPLVNQRWKQSLVAADPESNNPEWYIMLLTGLPYALKDTLYIYLFTVLLWFFQSLEWMLPMYISACSG